MPKGSTYPSMSSLTGAEKLLGVQGPNTEVATVQQIIDITLVPAKAYTDSAVAGVVGGPGFFQQSGTGSVGRTFQSKMTEIAVSPEDFGAVGDGVTNDTAAINKADAALPIGGTLRFAKGKKYLVDGIRTTRAGIYDGEGATLILSSAGVTAGSAAATVGAALYDYTYITPVSITAGTVDFTITEGVDIQVGDLLELRSTTTRIPAAPSDYLYGRYGVVDSIVGGVAKLSSPHYASFSVTRVRVIRGPQSIEVKNLNFDLTNSSATAFVGTTGLSIVGKNYRVSNCTAKGNDYAGSAFICSGENAIIENCTSDTFLNLQGTPLPGRVGYGILLVGNNLTARNNTSKYCKHGVTTGSRDFTSSNLCIEGNSVYEDLVRDPSSYGGSIDSHANVFDIVRIIKNKMWSRSFSLSIRNGQADCDGNEIFSLAGNTGILLTTYEVVPTSVRIRNSIIQMNTGQMFFDPAGQATSGLSFESNTISGGALMNSIQRSIVATTNMKIIGNTHTNADTFVFLLGVDTSPFGSITNLVIRDNNITLSTSGTATDNCIYLAGSAGNAHNVAFTNVEISNNTFDMSGRGVNGYGIQVNACTATNFRISKNRLKRQGGGAYTQRGFLVANTEMTSWVIADNMLDSGLTIQNTGITSNCRAVIQGNQVETIAFNDNDAANPLVLALVKILNNVVSTLQSLTPMTFSSVAGSTAWGGGNTVVVRGNIFESPTSNSITANANTTGNVIEVVDNRFTGVWFDATGGYLGSVLGNTTSANQPYRGSTFALSNGDLTLTAAPTTGTWQVNQRVRNRTPAVGQPKSWICTAAGTPGTWVSEGNL